MAGVLQNLGDFLGICGGEFCVQRDGLSIGVKMARRGPKPAPTYLQIVRNARPNRINKAEAKIRPSELPYPPDFLSEEAIREWNRVSTRLYDAGLLTHVDSTALAAYCQAFGRWERAERQLREDGKLVVTTQHNNQIPNPLLGIANRAMHDCMRYAAELGMTPSARSRVTARPPEGDEDPAAKYLD